MGQLSEAPPAPRLLAAAIRLWPGFDELPPHERRGALAELVSAAFNLPLALLGLGWLAAVTDWAALARAWPLLLISAVATAAVNQFQYIWLIRRPGGGYGQFGADLSTLVVAGMLLILGPSGLWASILLMPLLLLLDRRELSTPLRRLFLARSIISSIAATFPAYLAGLLAYTALGGAVPLTELGPRDLVAALGLCATFGVVIMAIVGAMLYLIGALGLRPGETTPIRNLSLFVLLTLCPPLFFALLGALLYASYGLGAYAVWLAGVALVSFVAHRLSEAAQASMLRSTELAQLEALGRALIAAPPDEEALGGALAAHTRGMFRRHSLSVRLFDGRVLLHDPEDAPPPPAELWAWLAANPAPAGWRGGVLPPWAGAALAQPVAAAPILAVEGGAPLGAIALVVEGRDSDPSAVLPALQSLAATVASALHRAEEHRRALTLQRVSQELSMAWQIQASFLPPRVPLIPGWQLAATLRPARETSGDFYDLLDLPDGRLGLVVADVADKGTGAALFMALTRTLIRTYAFEYPQQPEAVLQAANRRILSDTQTSMFVTVFYGILEVTTGRLVYANAGHNPPFILSPGRAPEALRNTGIPLGIEAEMPWDVRETVIAPGALALLYTDGISEAQNGGGELFAEGRLLDTARLAGPSAGAVQAAVLTAVDGFVGAAPQYDDMTLMVLSREA